MDHQKKDLNQEYLNLQKQNTERLKELQAINQTTEILRSNKDISETLHQIVLILPSAWQFPENTVARVVYQNLEMKSPKYRKPVATQKQSFETIDKRTGFIEIGYTRKFPDEHEGPFLKEERDLINNLAGLIEGFLNSVKGQSLIGRVEDERVEERGLEERGEEERGEGVTSRKLLQQFLNKSNVNRDVYHDLMTFKVKEILLVANLYDAYSIEKDGKFSEHVLGEYHQLNLTSLPRITGVSSPEEVFEQLQKKHFDLIIYMVGVDQKTPISLSSRIKRKYPYIPIFLLLNSNSDIEFFERRARKSPYIDRTFVWNGDSRIFFSMIKLVEDKINLERDTQIGLVRVILLVEDSPLYYSNYLPLLYKIVMEQTKRIIEDVSTDELYKVLRMRARPKIILASTYEGATEIIDKYGDYLLCLITDVKYSKDGEDDSEAGFKLVKHVRTTKKTLPCIIQSSNISNAKRAYELKSTFIDKNSESLLQDFQSFITYHLGFGNFIYKNSKGDEIGVAKTLREFENKLKTIPDDSLMYHARKDHFSLWLMARGEIQAAKVLNPKKVTDYESADEIRQVLIENIHKFRNEQNKGKIIPFEESAILDDSNILSLSEGQLGGKGRGLAFINTLIQNYNFEYHVPNINIKAPKTSVIGTDEFEIFLTRNKLWDVVSNGVEYEEIKQRFLSGHLSDSLEKRLRSILKKITKPIAIRSSGLFEDSLMQPFAGIFETYLLPNSHPDLNVRVRQTMDAIKLVYASVYSPVAKGYIEAINYKIEQEMMAVILQEVVGKQYDDYFYPHISGVAQSYNYYPVAHMKPEEGFAVAAVGLGKYVVEGEKAHRFSPKYPGSEINSPKDQFKNSQTKFFAVDLSKQEVNLLDGDTAGLSYLDIDVAEKQGTIKHCASVYDANNNIIYPGLTKTGPRIINFANIIKYNYIPLAKTIEIVLDVVKEALGTPVEIEFAVDLNRDHEYKSTFYLLQIKPLIGSAQDYTVDMDKIEKESILLYTEKCMGNGLIKNIKDVIYVDPDRFDKTKTEEMAQEIEILNRKMIREGRQYILIGPGRWGTRDKWIGIPVNWPQISNAKVIVETSLEGFPLDASSGSHFFHNVTSMNVGYFSVHQELSSSHIKWDSFDEQEVIEETTFFKHIRYSKAVKVRMDGKKRIAVITH